MKTPILFTLEPFIEQTPDPPVPVPIPTTPDNELDLITNTIILSPRYYLIIKPPSNIRNDASYIPMPYRYNVPWEGIYANQVRLALEPTVGWGEGSCYEVEYWMWRPHLLPRMTKKIGNTPTKLKTEHWLVPHPSGKYLLNYSYAYANQFRTEVLSLVVTANPMSIKDYMNKLVYVVSVNNEPTFTLSSVVAANTSLLQRTVNYKNTTDVLLTTSAAIGETISIEYLRPIDIKNILFKNNVFPQNIYAYPLGTVPTYM
jgi:hypothetical protein